MLVAEVVLMLEFDAASKRYDAVAALDVCTFRAAAGPADRFLGPNGAGKTTAMRAVFGLVELDTGAVRWRGSPIGPTQRMHFGYMPEERGLYPRMRVRDQLLYLGRLCGRSTPDVRKTVDRWLDRLALTDRANSRLDTLSHGNQQRVQLIAALVNEPELLVLDEPFAGLDPIAIDNMANLLREVVAAGNRAVLQPSARSRRASVRGRRHHRPRTRRPCRRSHRPSFRSAGARHGSSIPRRAARLVGTAVGRKSSRRTTASSASGSTATPTSRP